MTDSKNNPGKKSWEEEKKDFAKKAFAEALDFMKKDNEMIGHFTIITASLSNYIKENPEEISRLIKPSVSGESVSDDPAVVAGGDFGSEVIGLIRDVLLGDKEFILNMVKDLLRI
ncbi:MAG: hypothetical protein NTW29_04320 [Bacteroidetes bacterium]|nr:hypothetical protein [Bacteroidota bacterium]